MRKPRCCDRPVTNTVSPAVSNGDLSNNRLPWLQCNGKQSYHYQDNYFSSLSTGGTPPSYYQLQYSYETLVMMPNKECVVDSYQNTPQTSPFCGCITGEYG